MKKLMIFLITAMLFCFLNLPAMAFSGEISSSGQLVKTVWGPTVYLIKDGNIYVFPDSKTYQSWHGQNFTLVKNISEIAILDYKLAGNVTYKPGSLIKIQTDPKVYEVLNDAGAIKWVETEAAAAAKFGANWASLASDVPAAFFTNYSLNQNMPNNPDVPTPPAPPAATTTPLTFDQTAAQPSLEGGMTGLIRLTENQIGNANPDIAWNGSNYGLVWTEGNTAASDIYFNYVNLSGNLGGRVKINPANIAAFKPNLTWDGTYFAASWIGRDLDTNEWGVYFSKIDVSGRIYVSAKKIASADQNASTDIDDYDTKYAIVWTAKPTGAQNYEVYFANLDDLGVIKNNILQITTTDSITTANPKIGWNGSTYGIFWQDETVGGTEINYASVDTSSEKITNNTQVANQTEIKGAAAIAWDGTTYALIFPAGRISPAYYFNLIYADGTKKYAADLKINDTKIADGAIGVTYTNNHYYIISPFKATDAKADDGYEIYITKLASNGDISKQERVTYNPWQSTSPVIATDDDTFGIIWIDGRATCENCALTDPKRDEIYFVKYSYK